MDNERKRELKRAFKHEERADARCAMVLDESELSCLLDYLDERLTETGCDHSLRVTHAWAAEHTVDPIALTASLNRFGGYCDWRSRGQHRSRIDLLSA